MPRPLRFAPADVPQHVRARGNQQQEIFFNDEDRTHYLRLLAEHCSAHCVGILGYCLMTNHVHLVLRPSNPDGLSRAMQRLNSEYAQSLQFRLSRTGHLWQGRFKATPMDELYCWTALRYVERNPLRAGRVARCEQWPWSSAADHVGRRDWTPWLERSAWAERFTESQWATWLASDTNAMEEAQLRRATRENRPLARPETIGRWEAEFGRSLRPGQPGRPRREERGSGQCLAAAG